MNEKVSCQIVGLVRFSFVTTGEFYPGFSTPKDLSAFLFKEGRLKRRFRLFEKICLPSLAAQTDQNFTCIFLTSEDLPEHWRARLDAALAPYPWARVVSTKPGQHYPTITNAFDTVEPDGSTHRVTFRLDDDDAFDLGHIARLRDQAERYLPVHGPDLPLALAYNRGIYVTMNKGEDNEIFDAIERAPLSVGAALVMRAGERENVYRQNHRALPAFYNCCSDANEWVFLRTIHQDNKSSPHFSGEAGKLSLDTLGPILSERFGFDPEMLLRL